jgi:hypothetical protein
MAKISRQVGTTNEILNIFIRDATNVSSAGLANVSSTSVSFSWMRSDQNGVSSGTATAGGTLGAYSVSTLTEMSSSLALGWYQFSPPNTVFTSGTSAILHLYGYPNMAPTPIEIELTKDNNQQYVSSQVFSSTQTVSTISAISATAASTIAFRTWDEILTASVHNIATSAGRRLRTLQTGGSYEGGAVWIDTVNGTAGTVLDENGTVNLPVLTLADALTIATAGGFNSFHVANGSTITLTATTTNKVFTGENWTLALGTQDIGGTYFEGATSVTGTGTGTQPKFNRCTFGIVTLPACVMEYCNIAANSGGGFTCSGAGSYLFHECRDTAIVSTFPIITLFAGSCGVLMNTYAGYVKFAGMTHADARVEISGAGTIEMDSGNTNGSILMTGTWDFVDNGTGLTITQTANVANEVNADVQKINAVTVLGTGVSGDLWRG